jgi:hypothetical protein
MTTADRVKTRGRSLYGTGSTIPPCRRHPSPFPERKRVASLSESSAPREIVSYRQPEIRATVAQGCDVCGALAKQWDDQHDRDLLLEINNHPHTEPKLSRVTAWVAEGASVG